jgi:hypothetical protein
MFELIVIVFVSCPCLATSFTNIEMIVLAIIILEFSFVVNYKILKAKRVSRFQVCFYLAYLFEELQAKLLAENRNFRFVIAHS